MYTRDTLNHQYQPTVTRRVNVPGSVKVTEVNGVQQTWAVARPNSSPIPTYAPPAPVQRGGVLALTPGRPHVMMDPSDQQTWQREYRFTQ